MLMLYMSLVETPEEKDKFEELYYQYRALMHYCAKEILKDDGLAEDAVHNAFIKIIRFLDKIGDVKCNKTKRFVVIVVENSAKDIYRKRKHEMEVPWEEVEMTYQFPYKSDMGELSEVETAIMNLPLTYRQIFILKYAQGYSCKEIATLLNMKTGTVRQRIARGKECLYENLKKQGVCIDGKDTNR